MKKALLIVCAVVCSVFYVAAQQYQDVVYLKNGSIVRGIIMEQVPGKTIKIATDNGSQFIFTIAEIEKMTKELPVQQPQQPVYQQSQQPQYQPAYRQPRPAPVAKAPKVRQPIDWSIRYKGEINVGYAISGKNFDWNAEYSASYEESYSEDIGKMQTVFSRPLIETIHGAQIGPYFFVGAGIGLQYYYGKLNDFQEFADISAEVNGEDKPSERWNAIMLPIFANIKFMCPVNEKFAPFLNLGLGGTVGCYSSVNCQYVEDGVELSTRTRGGFYCDFGAGFRYKMLNLSFGLQHQGFAFEVKNSEDSYGVIYSEKMKLSTKINSFYVKVGVNF